MKTTFIYVLIDPFTNQVRYVGKTNNPKYRLWAHIHDAKHDKRNMHKCNWIKKLLSKGKRPILSIIEEVSIESWEEREIFWIKEYRRRGANLINKTKGGECGIISENCINALKKSKKRGHLKGTFHHSEDTKKLIKEKRAKQGKSWSKKVKEVKENGEVIIWESMSDVARHYKVEVSAITYYINSNAKKRKRKIKSEFYYL